MKLKITEAEKILRNDRVTYIYLCLHNDKPKMQIEKIIENLGITSMSTARRRMSEVELWSKNEKDLFCATYEPVREDLEKVKDVLGLDKEEIIEKVVDVEIDENEECNTELASKIAELQKELHTQKCVIDSLQKENIEKDEEIRVLRLEKDKYKNDLQIMTDERDNYKKLSKSAMRDYYYLKDRIAEFETEKIIRDESAEIKLFADITQTMIQLYKTKNKDYGNAFTKSYEEFGEVMSVIRINDKLNRFKTLIKQDSEVKTESIIDTLIDLANYAVMTIMEIEKEDNWRDNEN